MLMKITAMSVGAAHLDGAASPAAMADMGGVLSAPVSDDKSNRAMLENADRGCYARGMLKVPSVTKPKTVRSRKTGQLLEVRGFGALRGRLVIADGIDLTEPIYDQVTRKAETAKPAKS